ncbi:hypothetical protein [Modestobacter marinus]|uniref:hypothetical protein n=1 Tax=Modestobacter marinus TaxID=477641 RepID=UPI001C93EC10|nr:hypothetical protein [Modestobacter marinus]
MARMRVGPVLVTGLVVALLGAGCASSELPGVERVATLFADPDGDPAERCDLLAPATEAALTTDEGVPCPEALPGLPIGAGAVRSVAVWDREAQVQLTDDTLFLTRTDRGWRVTAAACTARPDRPYVCALEGS